MISVGRDMNSLKVQNIFYHIDQGFGNLDIQYCKVAECGNFLVYFKFGEPSHFCDIRNHPLCLDFRTVTPKFFKLFSLVWNPRPRASELLSYVNTQNQEGYQVITADFSVCHQKDSLVSYRTCLINRTMFATEPKTTFTTIPCNSTGYNKMIEQIRKSNPNVTVPRPRKNVSLNEMCTAYDEKNSSHLLVLIR